MPNLNFTPKKITKISNFVKFPILEQEITKFWQSNNIFHKTLQNREGKERYSFMDGPPFVTGSPHYGSLIPSIAKDVIPRYQTMKGKYVRRVFGWDCHGLPIEEKVSSKLGLKTRDQIEEYGIDKYIKACRTHVNSCTTDWRYYIDAIGRWVDMDNAYYTMNPEFNESVLWLFAETYKKGLIYKGNRVSLYSVDNQTPVSEFEVNMDPSNYRDVADIAIYATFPITNTIPTLEEISKDAKLIIWTTTPWTIPAHLCIAYNIDIMYTICLFEGQKYILSENRILETFQTTEDQVGTENGKLVQVLARFSGDLLKGLKYQSIYNYNQATEKHYTLYQADYVTDTDGTGLVHIAKYGKEDIDLCKKYDIELFDSITLEGIMLHGRQKGTHMREALENLTEELREMGRLFRSHTHTHRLPFYRGPSPLIFMPQDSYFIDVQKLKPKMIELNQAINWYPKHFQNGRFLDVITNAPDWCISRNRFWATIMPLWVSADGEELVVDSIATMAKYTNQIQQVNDVWCLIKDSQEPQKLFLHRDFCDQIILTKDGKEFKRIPEVLDCWLDASAVPFAEFGYPFRNKKEFEASYPADYIVEYTGQIRAWFNMLLRSSVIAFDNLAFKNAIVHGNMAGNDGRKMSKSFGNYPDPKEVLENIGAEALRLQLMGSSVMNGEDVSWSDELLHDQVKNVIIPLWNTFTYFTIYADIHNYTPANSEYNITNIMDRWLETRVDLAIKDFDEALANYDLPQAVKVIRPIIDDISTWYIRRSRERFASGDYSAMQNLYSAIIKLTKTFAPQMPFITEKIYQSIVVDVLEDAKESVHLEDYPTFTTVDSDLLQKMELVRQLSSLGLAIRSENNLAVRQPLKTVVTNLDNIELQEILKEELNCKEVIYTTDFVNYTTREMDKWIIGLDINLTEELLEEGQLADLTRKIQNARKNSGLTMGQVVKANFRTESQTIVNFLNKYSLEICKTTSLESLEQSTEDLTANENSKIEKIKFLDSLIYFKFL